MRFKDLYKTTRATEWWEYKIPPLFAIAYATILKGSSPFSEIAPWLLFLLIALAWGGAYAHTVNDVTDIDEDLACGKPNRMATISKKWRWLIPSICFLGGFSFFCCFILLGDPFSAVIYALPCISFSLYSFKPIRLKQRGIWGPLADAFGAHVFISLLMVSSISFFSNQSIDLVWFCMVGIWSLFFGLRGILWHQYYDRENDLKAHSITFATKTPTEQFKKYEKALIGIELLAFSGMLIKISLWLLAIFLLIYFIMVILRYKILGYKPVIVVNPKNSPLQILMLDFYQVFFPLGILLYVAYTQKFGWVLLLTHLILFPRKLVNILTDSLIIIKSIRKRILTSY